MEEEDTCRICRSGPEEDMPLYHPCKCSGSIAKVHQDCLIDWLQHSKKKSCELCNTQLRFHKVYSPSMPAKLPAYLYVRRFLIQSLLVLRLFLRSIVVGLSWCALLPLLNLGVWRLHFMVVDHIVWGLIGGAPPASRFTSSLSSNATINATQPFSTLILPSSAVEVFLQMPSVNASTSSNAASGSFLRQLLSDKMTIPLFNTTANATYRTLDHLAQETFEGQMLTCAIILFFVAIFLLREWCLQNLPQPVEGIAFAANPAPAPAPPQLIIPEPVIPAGLDWQVPENEQAGALQVPTAENSNHEGAHPSDGGDDAAEHSPLLRPRLRHGVPDPPELQGQTSERRPARTQSNRQLAQDGHLRRLSLEEMRRIRAERFDASFQKSKETATSSQGDKVGEVSQQEHDASDSIDKGKAKEEVVTLEESHMLEGEKGKSKAVEQGNGAGEGDGDGDEVWEDSTALLEQSNDEAQKEGGSSWESVVESDAGDTHISKISTAAVSVSTEETTTAETELDEEVEDGEEQAGEEEDNEVAALVEPAFDAHGWEDEADNGERLEDEMDGMLEAIGLQGPLINLFTNMLMMFVLCSFVLVIAVAMPYLIGRVFGVGTNFLKFVNVPVRGLRFFTDPLVDYIVYKSAKGVNRVMQTAVMKGLANGRAVRAFASALQSARASSGYQQVIMRLSSGTSTTQMSADDVKAASKEVVFIASKQTPRSKEAIQASLFALVSNLQTRYTQLSASLHALYLKAEAKTQGGNQDDKMFCVLLGHLYWLVGLFIQKKLSSLYLRWNLKWLKTTVDQQLVVFKVLAFIILELAIFPWCCGMLLDASLLPLWQDVTFSSRLALIRSNPLSVGFTQWALGTLYMFALAQFVSSTRSVVRPGVLCFVRDAGDPGFHPIKDILERKSIEQLRKIGVSGLIYSGILTGTIGFSSYAIYLADRQAQVFPLRWEMHQSLTTTGLEYVFLAVALPPIIKAWLPLPLLKKGIKGWWKVMARQLRISSYLIGGPFEDERGHQVGSKWNLTRKLTLAEGASDAQVAFIEDGGYGRVPADDQAIMSSPIVIRTDQSGEPITERGREAMQQQQEAIDKLTKKPLYTVVYLPPHFRTRIIALLVALWASISTCLTVILLAPLLTGRTMLDFIIDSSSHPPLHDGYSWLVGSMIIGAIVHLAKAALRLSKSNKPSRRLVKMARRVAEYSWMIFFVSLTGCLLGIAVELYINGLTRPFTSTKTAALPDVSVFHTWCTGTLLLFTVVQIMEVVRGPIAPVNWDKMPLMGANALYVIMQLRTTNLRRPNMWLLTKRGFLPSIVVFLYAIIGPLLLTCFIQFLFGKASTKEGQCLQIYLAFMICLKSLWFGLLMKAIGRMTDRWTALIRDEVFLISTQLKNYSSDDQKTSNGITDTHAADGPIPDAMLHR